MAALLVDEGIGRDLVQALVTQGFVVYHWLDIGPKGASDAEIFLEAQKRGLTIFTHNRQDYELLTHAWRLWGHGDHHGLITGRKGRMQLSPPQLLQVMKRYRMDNSAFINRIDTF